MESGGTCNLSASSTLGQQWIRAYDYEIIGTENSGGEEQTEGKIESLIEGIVEYNGHYYKAFNLDMTWNEAKEYCENLGGYLAVITSSDENSFVYSISIEKKQQDYWLGATDEKEEGTWKWITGENWEYTNWKYDQPDNNSNADKYVGEDYLQIWREGTWNDSTNNNIDERGYDEVGGFVCEWNQICDIKYANADKAIIDEVIKYTSDEEYAQWNKIMHSNLSHEEKIKQLNELAHNNGLTDVNEGIQYFNDVGSYRRDYLYLTTNENYCAFDWWYWLSTTIKGKIARGLLYADGLIFNSELTSYIDWTTYVNGSYPGVEKCKTMLKEFMETKDGENLAVEVAKNSKELTEKIESVIELNDIVVDAEYAEMEKIMNNVINAKTNKELEKYLNQFADKLIKQLKIQQKIGEGEDVSVYLGVEGIAEAMDYATPIINVVAATTEDIVGIMELESEIKKYEEYENFLMTIYSSQDVSKEMRIAAYQLYDEIENGYMKKITSILSNFISFEVDMIYMDKDMLNTYLESKGLSTATTDLLGEAMGTIKLATVISNIIIDTGDFVKQAAYTMSYAELSALYSVKLQEDREAFRNNPSADNAWKFYEDYNLLWRLRYKGEEQYLKMNKLKTVLGKIKALGYSYKEEVVNDILSSLKQCKFEFAADITVPKSVQYVKKAVIECPVDVLVYTKEGELIAELKDGVLSDTINEYGRFAVVYESYSGEYAKVICQLTDDELDIQIISVDDGLVDFKLAEADTTDILCFDKVPVEKGDIIRVGNSQYRILHNDGKEDTIGQLDVIGEEYVKPESILLSEKSLQLYVGEEKVIKVSVLPENVTNKGVNWYSEDEEIVKIKNGVVKAEAIGETVVWIKACDSDDVEACINVRVTNKEEISSDESENAADNQIVVNVPPKGTIISDSEAFYKVTVSDKQKGTVQYVKSNKQNSANVVIPDTVTIDNITYKITSIASNAFKNNKKVVKVTIGNNVKDIGTNAFYGCNKLKTIVLGKNVASIGIRAFYKCNALTKISFGSKVTKVGGQAFYGCENLKTVVLGKNVKTIGDKAFYKCIRLTKITIPGKVTNIGNQAFYGCKKLKNVTLGKNVEFIGDKAFSMCNVLTRITIPSKVKKIGTRAFYGCKSLKSITIKTTKLNTKKIGENAFKGIYENAIIKVPKSKLDVYKSILKKKGIGSKVIIKK